VVRASTSSRSSLARDVEIVAFLEHSRAGAGGIAWQSRTITLTRASRGSSRSAPGGPTAGRAVGQTERDQSHAICWIRPDSESRCGSAAVVGSPSRFASGSKLAP